MRTMEVRKETSFLLTESFEVNNEDSSARLQNSSDFVRTLRSRFLWEVMKHDSAKHRVELSILKRKRLDQTLPEGNLDAGLFRLLLRPRKHFSRGINSVDRTVRPDSSFCGNRKRSSSATNIKNAIAGAEARKAQHLITKYVFLPQECKPDGEVIENW